MSEPTSDNLSRDPLAPPPIPENVHNPPSLYTFHTKRKKSIPQILNPMRQEMMKDKRWFSALNVVAHFGTDFAPGLGTPQTRKKAEEMWAVAVMIAGIQEAVGSEYWMQSVSDTEGSPDVRTTTIVNRPAGRAPDYAMQDVEVVTYTAASSSESLPEFLLRTKLSPKKAYDSLTTILIWAKDSAYCPPRTEWDTVLAGVKSSVTVVLVGQSKENEPVYSLIQVHPDRKNVIEFDLNKTLLKQGYTGVITLSRGVKDVTVARPEEEHCPFESIGVDCLLMKDEKSS